MLEGAKSIGAGAAVGIGVVFSSHFLGSEGRAIMTTGINLVLFGILLLALIFHLYSCRLTTKFGFFIKCISYLSLLFLILLYCNFLRIYLVSCLGLCLSGILSNFFIYYVLGEEIILHSGPSAPSSSEATSVDQGTNRNEAGAASGSGQPAVDQRAEGGSTAEFFPSLSSIEELPSLSNERDEVEQPVQPQPPNTFESPRSLTSSDQSYLRRFFGEDQAGINNRNLDQASPSSATN